MKFDDLVFTDPELLAQEDIERLQVFGAEAHRVLVQIRKATNRPTDALLFSINETVNEVLRTAEEE